LRIDLALEAHHARPAPARRLDEPIVVSLEALVPVDHVYMRMRGPASFKAFLREGFETNLGIDTAVVSAFRARCRRRALLIGDRITALKA
jgi:hypothetical protein